MSFSSFNPVVYIVQPLLAAKNSHLGPIPSGHEHTVCAWCDSGQKAGFISFKELINIKIFKNINFLAY
jgi:hypothetical protein